jgi:hypothetical protein
MLMSVKRYLNAIGQLQLTGKLLFIKITVGAGFAGCRHGHTRSWLSFWVMPLLDNNRTKSGALSG